MDSTSLTKPVDLQGLSLALAKTKADYEAQIDQVAVPPDWEMENDDSFAYILNKPAIRAGEGEGSIIEGQIEADNGAAVYTIYVSGSGNTLDYTTQDTLPNYLNWLGVFYDTSQTNDNVAYCSILDVDTTNHKITVSKEFSSVTNLEAKIYYKYKVSKGVYSHSEGANTFAIGSCAHAEGNSTKALKFYSHAEGNYSSASGTISHAEGSYTTASGGNSHSEGNGTLASGSESHAEGYQTTASGMYSHAEGSRSTASNFASHAEGSKTTASGSYSHAEGLQSTASNNSSHAEGSNTTASGGCSHAEGYNVIASGNNSHAEGSNTTASSSTSHAEGYYTIASGASQHVQGKYNIEDSNNIYADIVGNGAENNRSNAYTLDWSGNGWYAGKVTVGAAPTNNMDVATKQYVDNAMGSATTTISGLTDTTITSVANGDVLIYDSTSSKWINSNLTTIVNTAVATALAEYGDGDTASYGITDGNEVSY